MTQPQLLLGVLGPVQGFIAGARRSRDLWFSSWLISELAKAAARAIAPAQLPASPVDERPGLIFPAPNEPDDLEPGSPFSAPNKIIALIAEPPADVAERMKIAIDERLTELWDDAYAQITGALIDLDTADLQRDDLVEFAWVALPLARPADYAATRARLEALMAARKQTRTFSPVTWGSSRPKSSLDGQREAVIDSEAYDEPSDWELYRNYGVRRGERLCGIGLLKRHGRREKDAGAARFFSTSHVAALPLIARIKNRALVDGYAKQLRDLGINAGDLGNVPGEPHPAYGRYDGHLLFAERLHEYLPDKEACTKAKIALRAFLKQATGGREPNPYYALLHADGDGMGKAIDAQTSIAAHRRLSQALAGFADEVRKIVADHSGSLVYAGGDDVLAFLPLHTVLTCARALAESFAKAMAPFTYGPQGDPHRPSLSVGVAIAHHLDALSDTLDAARAAERAAKNLPGKNALAVSLLKRSGEPRRVLGHWQTAAPVQPLDARLADFVRLHLQQRIPDGLAYEWHDLGRSLTPGPAEESASSEEAQLRAQLAVAARYEARRILDRKRAGSGSRALAPEELTLLQDLIDHLPLTQIADELVIARALSLA